MKEVRDPPREILGQCADGNRNCKGMMHPESGGSKIFLIVVTSSVDEVFDILLLKQWFRSFLCRAFHIIHKGELIQVYNFTFV